MSEYFFPKLNAVEVMAPYFGSPNQLPSAPQQPILPSCVQPDYRNVIGRSVYCGLSRRKMPRKYRLDDLAGGWK
ncbi:hypothetical protein [Candidatus Accumulibacter cognatus]|uniref:Uncharacterized protein n=1 Tax=Candidatus Accumulibacter cognatus TaxID=2954383 RepID=A0A080MG84_9PROT|nr:hypothetical protein [Candidatus Accumulibacter cognatus]KFB76259.1 MAG: hypothetical protein AW06_002681 [Candidatus Accumulibacter cognatus]QLH51382.1 MAG: hypothetical protein HWD57_17400 [Candidatus Accumulibacter cognatus]